jgi:hypothetical protein
MLHHSRAASTADQQQTQGSGSPDDPVDPDIFNTRAGRKDHSSCGEESEVTYRAMCLCVDWPFPASGRQCPVLRCGASYGILPAPLAYYWTGMTVDPTSGL